MTAVRSRCGAGVLAALAAAIGMGVLVGASSAQDSPEADPLAVNAVLPDLTDGIVERAEGGIQLRNVPPFAGVTNGCQPLVSPGTAFITGPAYKRADNFKPLANSAINGVSWTGYFRQLASQAAATSPGGESFEIRFLSDNFGVPGAVVAGPFTVTPTVTPDGTFGAGGPVIYDYVATLPSPVNVTGGECYWLELRHLNTGGNRWFWHAAPINPGDTVSYGTGINDPSYEPAEQTASDLAFCLDIELDSLTTNPCPIATIPTVCANPDANGQPRAGANTGFSSNLAGSMTVATSVAFERAEAFRLTNSGDITNVCFYAFWNSFGAAGGGNVGGGFPANPDIQITYYSVDPNTGLSPGGILAQYRVGDPGVTLARDATGIHRIDHPAVSVLADTCYFLSLSYLSNVNDASRHAIFLWGTSFSSAPNTDGLIFTRTTNTTPIGPWNFTANTGSARGLSFLFNVGVSILPCTPGPASNVSCATATPLTAGAPGVAASNIGIPASVLPPCQFSLIYGNIAWFTLIGDGSTVTVSTCDPLRVGDPNLSVYCAASCAGPFNCVLGNNDLGTACAAGALSAGVTFPTVVNATYYIALTGVGGSLTAFRIAATSDGILANPPAPLCDAFVRCEISGEPATPLETDPCTTSTATNTNATCATALAYPAFGTTVGGRISTYLNGTTNTRDLDYWRLPMVSQPTRVTWRIYSETPTLYQFQNFGAAGCTGTATVITGATRTACLNTFLGETTIPANSTVVLLITPPDFQGLACPNFNDYRLTINIVPQGACCVPATACFVETAANCDTQAGEYQGDDSTCEPTDPCTAAAMGACCAGTTCSVDSQANCMGSFTRYAGDNTTCNVAGNFITPCCKADHNQSGAVTVQDIFDFLADYFSANPRADINGGGTSVQDIFDFLSIYFAGCP